MVWRETGIMDERLRFVVECLSGEETMTQLCAAFDISRKTGYKWLGRYRASGPEGLHDRPRAEPGCGWPAVSTAGEILKRHG
ncbi:MAG: helix-turn-helix domain-containing protein, partial [Mesorhizobium sp.]